ncbi:MAG: tetratricopeptide repeat protein [Magnetococcus sp. XQGC-1]
MDTANPPSSATAPASAPTLETRMQEAMQQHRAGRLQEAEALYQQLLVDYPNHPDALHLMGYVCFQQGKPQLAAEWIEKAVALQPNQPIFLQNLGIIRAGLGRSQEAVDCFRRVLAIQPQHHEALFHLAGLLREQGKRAEAIDCFQQAIAINPNLYEAYNCLGNLMLGEKKAAEAIACYRKTVEIHPQHQNAYTNLGNVLLEQKEIDEAILCYQKAIEIQPTLCEAINGLGNAYKEAGKLDEAVACFQRALTVNPRYHTAYHNLGIVMQMQGELEESIRYYKQVLLIQPNATETCNNMGTALAGLGQTEAAIEYYHKALAINPKFHQAYGNIGIALQKNGELEKAIPFYRQALEIAPNDCTTLSNLGFALQLNGEVKDSIACYEKVLSIAPDDPEAHGSVLHQMLQICDWQGFQSRFTQMMETFHASKRDINPFILLSVPTSAEEQLACATLSSKRRYGTQKNYSAQRRYDLHPERLKIGYLSCDYQDHATTHLIAELFELHDRNRYEIFAYSYGQDDGLSMRRRVMAACEHFVDMRHFSHRASAQRILDDGIHILLELKGYTKDSRLEIPALRPAPIQGSWLGYPGTLGIDFIDYIFSDPFVSPPEFASHYTEKIVRLDGCYQPNDRKRPIDPQTPTRQACGLPETGFLFVCFNKNYKINPPIFDIWMRLLQKTPGSILWLFESNHWIIENIRREARARGVDENRLFFAPKMPPAQHLARYRLADLVLDTFPYTSHTTGSDALWAGAPLLTYAGETFASRVAGSLLVNVGLPELITYSLEEYESLALELAHNPERLAAIRQRLHANLPTAPLFDSPRFTRSMEAAFELMWQRFQAGLAPDHIDVRLGDQGSQPPPRPTPPPAAKPAAPPVARSLPPVPPPPKTPSTALLLAEARTLRDSGQHDAAISLYQRILATEANHFDALYGLAIAMGGKGLIVEGLEELVKARTVAPDRPMDQAIQPLILRAGEIYNNHLKANQLEMAARVIDALSRTHPSNLFVLDQAFLLFKRMERSEQTIRVAKLLWKQNPAHFAAHQELVGDCQNRKDVAGELEYRIAMARLHPRAIPTAFHLQEVYMALCVLLISTLDKNKISQIEELLALAKSIVTDNPVAENDPLYHSYMFYRVSIESLNIPAVLRPPPAAEPWPAIEFATANGEPMNQAAVRARLAATGAEIIFYIAADPVYTTRHARRYLSSVVKSCDVPFVVIVQVIGGMGRLKELAEVVGLTEDRLIFAADAFNPESIRAVTWKINETTPLRTPLVYYQSARFLWLGYLLEKFNLPVIVSDVDQLLQRGIKDMLERLAPHDVVFHLGKRNIKIADHLIANLLLVKPTSTGRLFAKFFRYYMAWALRDAEKRGHYAYFLDQVALLMARHHLEWMKKPGIGYFDQWDVNVGMFKSFQENPFRFFSFYTGFDMESLPDAKKP